jgi:rhamnogalacturonan endolyase
VRPVLAGIEQAPSDSFLLAASTPTRQYFEVPLQIPSNPTVPLPPGTDPPPSGTLSYNYNANDGSVGDLDGDGQYEIVLKWEPSNSQDNSNEGLTGFTIFDAYRLDGTLLWRINLGRNVRAGAHYSPFLVYDFDGDGRSEFVVKTADGTTDGLGNVIGNPTADYRDGYTGSGDGRWGRILSGPEFLTVFDGLTGAALSTVPFSPPRGSVSSWGDSYGNRVDRFHATVAYLDGVRPSIVMSRGYYEKTMLTAFDWRNGQLTQRWVFDSTTPGNDIYEGQGNHNLSVGDVDLDGKDEIIFGSATFNDDGKGLYTTGYGHGDAMHFSDLDPNRPGLEVFKANGDTPDPNAIDIHDARTGQTLWSFPSTNSNGVGRAVALDIDPRFAGYELWSTGTDGNLHAVNGAVIGTLPSNMFYNFGVWWDAEPLRELLDGTTISDWVYTTRSRSNYVSSTTGAPGSFNNSSGLSSNNGSKSTPVLSGDIIGDWREEVIWRRSNNTALQIWTTATPATSRIYTLMHDPQYRQAIAWQNSAYNQPPS